MPHETILQLVLAGIPMQYITKIPNIVYRKIRRRVPQQRTHSPARPTIAYHFIYIDNLIRH